MMLRVSSPLCGSRVEYALDAVFISDEKTPTSSGTPLKKSLFCTKQHKIKYIYMFCATIYCM